MVDHPPDNITKAERAELVSLIKLRQRVAKADADARAAQLIADFEAQIAAVHKADHPKWVDLTEAAAKAAEDLDRQLAERCRELGIPARFRPSLSVSWYGRGENAVASRRAELRKVAVSQIEASTKAAKLEIDRAAAGLLTELAAGALVSGEAREFLERLPTPEQLMPGLVLRELEAGRG